MKADAIKVLDANESSAEDGQAKPRIQSAVRTISILLAVADSPNGLKAKEIMEKLGLSRQVTYHLIHTMHGTGIIRKNDSNRYVLGLATVSIAEGFSRQLAPPEHLARRVRAIVAATTHNETRQAREPTCSLWNRQSVTIAFTCGYGSFAPQVPRLHVQHGRG